MESLPEKFEVTIEVTQADIDNSVPGSVSGLTPGEIAAKRALSAQFPGCHCELFVDQVGVIVDLETDREAVPYETDHTDLVEYTNQFHSGAVVSPRVFTIQFVEV